jgi:hypothetical protein
MRKPNKRFGNLDYLSQGKPREEVTFPEPEPIDPELADHKRRAMYEFELAVYKDVNAGKISPVEGITRVRKVLDENR